jgi:hypothetical protein
MASWSQLVSRSLVRGLAVPAVFGVASGIALAMAHRSVAGRTVVLVSGLDSGSRELSYVKTQAGNVDISRAVRLANG